jgi:hypothetical protein
MSTKVPEIDEAVQLQMDQLELLTDRPIIIVDADEVLFQFMAKFLHFLEGNNYRFDWSSFALTGNIRDADTDEVIDATIIRDLMPRFFSVHASDMDPVADAAAVLKRLSDRTQIIVLSNVPVEARADRLDCLKKNDLDYPLIANKGAKGPVVNALLNGSDRPAVFIDDIPHNHTSVADWAAHVFRLHFIAHPRLAQMLDKADSAHHRANTWLEMETLISSHLKTAGY